MSFARSVGRNTAIQFVGKIVSTLLGVVVAGAIQRYLLPAGYGEYTAAMAYVGFFSVIADLGLYLIMIRELNKPGADTDRVVGNLLALRWTSALIVLVGSAIVAYALPFYSSAVKSAIQIGALSFIAVAGSQLLVAVFQTKYQTVWITVGEVAGRLVLLGTTLLTIRLGGGLNTIMTAVAIGSITNLLIILVRVRRFASIRLRFEMAYWRELMRIVIPVSLSVVLSLIYFKADTILLNVFGKDEYDVGLYGAAYKILEILITFPIIFVGLILPALGRFFSTGDKEGFTRVFQRGFETLLVLVSPILVGGWMLAQEILVLVGGAEFAPASSVLRLLLIAVTMSYLNSLSAHVVTIINRQRQMVWGHLAVAIIGLVVYCLLIPPLSYTGAAIGTIVTEALTPIIGFTIILRVMKFPLRLTVLPKILIASGAMAGSIALIQPANAWLGLVIGSIIYVGLILALRAVPWRTVREVLGRSDNVEVMPPT